MRGLKNLLLEEKKRLEKIVKVVQVQLKTMPEGSLRLSKSKEYIQYYHCTEENKLGKYIVNGNDELIQALAQKSYDEKLLHLAEKRLNTANKAVKADLTIAISESLGFGGHNACIALRKI